MPDRDTTERPGPRVSRRHPDRSRLLDLGPADPCWDSARGRLASVALPLLVVPPVILLTVSQFRPLFHERYVLYALAGAPLLVAAGADWLVGMAGRLWLESLPRPEVAHGEGRVAVVERRPQLVGAVTARGHHSGATARDHHPGAATRPPLTGIDRTTEAASPSPSSPKRPARTHLIALAGVLALAVPFLHGLPAYRNDRLAAHRPENLAEVSALAGRELRTGDPVLFLPSFWRVTELAYPGPFAGVRDLALAESGARSGTLSGREVAPAELEARLAGVDRVWIVAQSNLLPSRWVPGDPVDRVKLDVVDGEFARRRQYVGGRVKLALYIRRTPPPHMVMPVPAPPSPALR
ncbi:hypothetical protein ACRAWF_00925 [Streptomyces sp. L7]